jgi:glucose/arabinose dehydrogenase
MTKTKRFGRIGIPLVAATGTLVLLGCPPKPAPGGPIGADLFAGDLTAPVALVSANDRSGRLFVVSQPGTIEILDADGAKVGTFLDIRDRVIDLSPGYDERGLLGLAFHPDYAHNGRFFVFYNAPAGPTVPAGSDSEVRISEFLVSADDANAADPGSERTLLVVGKPQSNHNGGQLTFGTDGRLYFGIGDGGGAGDRDAGHNSAIGNAQDLSTLLGKICRIDVDADDPYAIPDDNPFVGTADARGEIFALGFRNPWRFSIDSRTGRIFVGDVGQGVREEVDIVEAGGNYGWRVREGRTCYNVNSSGTPLDSCATSDADGRPLIEPILDYPRDQGTSVIGGFVYRGSALSELAGKYIFGDFSAGLATRGRVYVATEADGGWSFEELLLANFDAGRLGRYVYAFGQDDAGELYVLTNSSFGPTPGGGSIFKLVQTE